MFQGQCYGLRCFVSGIKSHLFLTTIYVLGPVVIMVTYRRGTERLSKSPKVKLVTIGRNKAPTQTA